MHVSVQWHIFQELKLVDVDTATRGERKRLKFGQMVFHPDLSCLKRSDHTYSSATRCKMSLQKKTPAYGGYGGVIRQTHLKFINA
jgi:hypothetical protein